jgi:glycine betaine/proline transport system permease protein
VTTLATARRLTPRRPDRRVLVAGILAVWVLLWVVLRGRDTLALAPADLTGLHRFLTDAADSIGAARGGNPVFRYVLDPIRVGIDHVVTFLQGVLAQPAFGRPVPAIGWFGVVALAGFSAAVFANLRVALLAVAGLVFLGLQGLWQESMDTLALTLAAVLLALLLGIPLGIWAGLSDRFHRIVTPVLDLMQIMPTFVYLAPLALFFLIGPASATIATLVYAMPPAVRLTAHAIRGVPETTVEATTSLGATRRQTLLKVQLPMARRTIVLGINQTMMAALAMVTVAALIDAPGLGKTVVKALETLDVGTAFNAGLAIVVLAIVLDRVTTAASVRAAGARRGPAAAWRRPLVLAGGLVTAGCVWLSATYVWASRFPSDVDLGGTLARSADTATGWAQDHLSGVTTAFKDLVTTLLLNPFQSLLTESPWWLVALVVVALALVVGGVGAAVTSAGCLVLIVGSGLWGDSMTTLAATLVATVLVMALGITVGVWIGRSPRADRLIRPVLDAAQTMPAFVYLVPFLAFFAASRFTAIAAAVVFAAPVAVKIVADGIRAVSPTTVEAATAAGSSTWQVITKVQLPMARRALALATNQGLIYVLAMVVVGGLVGAGALGYDVVAGFSQGQLYGKGLAAGLAIVLLGVLLDRITQAAARRDEPGRR